MSTRPNIYDHMKTYVIIYLMTCVCYYECIDIFLLKLAKLCKVRLLFKESIDIKSICLYIVWCRRPRQLQLDKRSVTHQSARWQGATCR